SARPLRPFPFRVEGAAEAPPARTRRRARAAPGRERQERGRAYGAACRLRRGGILTVGDALQQSQKSPGAATRSFPTFTLVVAGSARGTAARIRPGRSHRASGASRGEAARARGGARAGDGGAALPRQELRPPRTRRTDRKSV